MRTPPMDTNYPTATIRVHLYPDYNAENPLKDWEHGIEFFTLPNASRAARGYHDIEHMSSPYAEPLDPGEFDRFREFRDDYYEDTPAHMMPSFVTWLNANCAAWGTVGRSGYDGTLRLYLHDAEDIGEQDGIACISRASFRQAMMIPAAAPMTKHFKQHATEMLQGVISEYNAWTNGDVYGYVVEEHNPNCPYCEDASEPNQDCRCWDATDDSCWGLIGYDYAIGEMNTVTEQYRHDEGKQGAA